MKNKYYFNLNEYVNVTNLDDSDAKLIIEDVLDTLIEVGNGVTDNDLHEAADKLFKFRECWLNKVIDERRN